MNENQIKLIETLNSLILKIIRNELTQEQLENITKFLGESK